MGNFAENLNLGNRVRSPRQQFFICISPSQVFVNGPLVNNKVPFSILHHMHS